MMRDLKDVIKLNSFQEICEVADKEQWCWNLFCGACGHVHFVHSLFLLIDEEIPEPLWTSKKQDILRSNSKKVQEKVKDVSIDYFANNFNFPDCLGYLGIALRYSEDAEKENRVLTTTWIPKLIPLMDDNQFIKTRHKIIDREKKLVREEIFGQKNNIEKLQYILKNNEVLTFKDLDYVESSFLRK